MTPLAQTLLALAALVVPLMLLGWRGRIFPQGWLLAVAGLPALASWVLVFWPTAWPGIVTLDVLVAVAALVDLMTLPRRREFSATRSTGRIASLAVPHRVELQLTHQGHRPRRVVLRDGLPQEFTADPGEFVVDLAPRSRLALRYQAKSARRGAFRLGTIHLRAASRWGLWQRFFDYPTESTVNVYPDLRQLQSYAVLARQDRLNLIGVRRSRRVGQDNEFERLRDYTPDDNYRHVEWRSTARRGKLTVKQFQQNQSQRVLFLIDCGRMMTNEAAGLSLLDHALNAVLMLSYVALSRGDAVGMVCFSDEIHQFLPARGGPRQTNRLLHAVFDQFPRLVESRYDMAFRYLRQHANKRSLVVLVTNVIDDVNARQVSEHLRHLAGRHLPLGVFLRDRRIYEPLDDPAPTGPSLYRAAAAADLLTWRHQVLADLGRQGVLLLDTFPEHLTAPLVNRYLEIKARHLL